MGGGEIGNIFADPRYLVIWLGLSDQQPSAFLVGSMGMKGSKSVDELAILGDLGEFLSLNFDFAGDFDTGTLTGEGEGVERPSVTDAVSGEATDVDESPDVGCGVTSSCDDRRSSFRLLGAYINLSKSNNGRNSLDLPVHPGPQSHIYLRNHGYLSHWRFRFVQAVGG
jgi:hypothetical protein